MAQNYEIDIKRFNGQDYDTLLPTPASHASTHQADGSDPITLQEGNYGDSSIPTSAYQNASVTRAKLAQDALYSPTTTFNSNRAIALTDLGKTLWPKWTSAGATYTLSLTADVSSALPVGFEVAIAYMVSNSKAQLTVSGVRMVHAGDGVLANAGQTKTLTIPEVGGMIALKKFDTNNNSGDLWLVTGNVEVVS